MNSEPRVEGATNPRSAIVLPITEHEHTFIA